MHGERRELNRLDVLRALRVSNWEAVHATVHSTLTTGAFQAGFALWLGANDFWMGVLGAVPTIAALVQLVSSVLVERIGERKGLTAWFSLAARSLWLPILLLAWLSPPSARLPAFVLLFTVASVLIQVPVPAFTSWLADLVPPDHRGRYFGRRNMLAGITVIVVSLPAAWFLDLASKRHLLPESTAFAVLFGIAVVFGVLSFACILRQAEPVMRSAPASDTKSLRAMLGMYRAPLAEPNFRRLLAFGVVFAAAQFFAAPFYTVYALQVLKLDYVWLQILGAVASLAALLSMPLWGYLSDKFGNKPLLAIGIAGVSLTPLPWVLARPEHVTAGLVILVLNNLAGGLFWAGVGLIQFNMLIALTPSERKPVYIGAMSALTGLAGGIAPIVGGAIVTVLHDSSFTVLGWHLSNYHVIFILNAVLRVAALGLLRGVRTDEDTTPRDVLAQISTVKVGTIRDLRQLQKAPTDAQRVDAAERLSTSRTSLPVEELVAVLRDPSLLVRRQAARTLGEVGARGAAPALIGALSEPGAGITESALDALGRIGEPSAVPVISHFLVSGLIPHRVAAAEALGAIGTPASVRALVDALEPDGGAEPARISGNSSVTQACLRALGAAGDSSAGQTIRRFLAHADSSVAVSAVMAAGMVADTEAAPELAALLDRSADLEMVAEIASSLASIGASEALGPVLSAALRHSSPLLHRQLANCACTLLGEQNTAYPLLATPEADRLEALVSLLKSLGRPVSSVGGRFGSLRRARIAERSAERLVVGDVPGCIADVLRLLKPGEETPCREVRQWAAQLAYCGHADMDDVAVAAMAVRSSWKGVMPAPGR